MALHELSDDQLVTNLNNIAVTERSMVSNMVAHVCEMERRRLYLNFNCTSMFEYLTEHLLYSAGSAQRRIYAARLSRELPEIGPGLTSGDWNLMQLSVLAQRVREKERVGEVGVELKREILREIKGCDLNRSQVIIQQKLELPPLVVEKKRIQADHSVRIEMTLTREQAALMDRVKERMSHVNPNPSCAEIFEHLAVKFLGDKVTRAGRGSKSVRYVSTGVRQQLLKSREGCQWRTNGQKCGSRFQLEVDHIVPLWAGGTSEIDNLQVLCDVHNRLKYEIELKTWPPSPDISEAMGTNRKNSS